MRRTLIFLLFAALSLGAQPPKLVYAKDGSGVFGYKDTPVQPWSGYLVHDPDRPAPRRIDPGEPSTQERAGRPPSDAVVLFDGKDLAKWLPSEWKLELGYVEATRGALRTKEEYGNFQLHLEWQAPDPPRGDLMDRGNSGVTLFEAFEIQIFDSYTTRIYADGQAASVYGQTPPLVNACRRPGQWESYDVIVFAPVFQEGKLTAPARVTMLHNGVLVHHNQEVYGTSVHRGLPKPFPPGGSKGPISLSAHNNPVRFRNIWVRPL